MSQIQANNLTMTGNTITGYVAVYNSLSQTLTRQDGVQFTEIILPGAFTATLADGHNIFALSSHDEEEVLGSTTAGTLILSEDANGLLATITLPDTTYAADLKATIGRGEPYGGSFTAQVQDWNWTTDQNGQPLCQLLSLSLSEVTVTCFAAYPETSVVLRSNRKSPEMSKDIPANKLEQTKDFFAENAKLRIRTLDL
jgi:uncharacterized protein